MLFQFMLTKIEYFYRENRYTLMRLFKHLQVQITTGGQLSGVNCPGIKIKWYLDLFWQKLSIFIVKNRYTLILLFEHLQVQIIRSSIIRGQLSGGKNITIPRLHFLCYTL